MNRKLVITNCYSCPFSKRINNEFKHGTLGESLECTLLNNQELSFTDKEAIPYLMDNIHESCKLDLDN